MLRHRSHQKHPSRNHDQHAQSNNKHKQHTTALHSKRKAHAMHRYSKNTHKAKGRILIHLYQRGNSKKPMQRQATTKQKRPKTGKNSTEKLATSYSKHAKKSNT